MRQRFEKMLYLSGSILFQILLIGLVINLAGCVAGIKPVAVKSGSMEPGDIVAFERGDGQLVLHRIVQCTKKGFITKGDANETQDIGVVRWDQIKGKQLFGLPYIGFLFLRTEKQMAVSLLIGSLILFSLFVIQNQFKRRI